MYDALILLILLGSVLGLRHWSTAGRDQVLAISSEICRDLNLQRLDDTVALRRIRPIFDNGFEIERGYVFEFSATGADRRRGEITLRGKGLQWARLEHPDGPVLIDTRRTQANR